jgi:hypothetical protein
MDADYKNIDLRLREGEYPYSLVKAIVFFELEQFFPNVKEIINRLYGEEKTKDLQFVRKIQTILKKMERSGIVRILPKNEPWDLQRYALSSFKFQDSNNNLVSFAADNEIAQAKTALSSLLSQQRTAKVGYAKLAMLVLTVGVSYAAILWSLIQPIVNPVIFVPAMSIAVVCCLALGKVAAKEQLDETHLYV